jgi:hypothetical protein
VYLGLVMNDKPSTSKGDTPMRANSALVIEPAASWQRLQQANEFFFEDELTQKDCYPVRVK